MTSNDFVVQNIYRYSRKSYKKNKDDCLESYAETGRDDVIDDLPDVPRSDRILDTAGCSCDIETESDIANILHKKCSVIALAQHQLQTLLDETDRILCDNTRCCRSAYDFFLLFKRAIFDDCKCRCALFILIAISFFIGLIIGAANCGTHLRRFNSPILTCIDNLFITDFYNKEKNTVHAIA